MVKLFFHTLWVAILGISLDAAAVEKPHVLFVAIDDLRPDLGCYGNTEVRSPQIDKLASEGIVFHRAYCQQALCGPSRVSIMTGVHPDQLKIWNMSKTNQYEWRAKCPNTTSLTEQFRKHGYKAIGFGKIYDTRLGLDKKHSWDEFTSGWKGMYADPASRKISKKKGRRPAVECADVNDDFYTDGNIASLGIEVIKNHNMKQPLFLAVGFTKPHLPFTAPKKYWDLYESSDGISLMPIIRDPKSSVRELAMTQYPRYEGTMAYSIRTAQWRYHEVRKKNGGEILAKELYNLRNGFIEIENLATAKPEVVTHHAVLLNTYLKKLRDNK